MALPLHVSLSLLSSSPVCRWQHHYYQAPDKRVGGLGMVDNLEVFVQHLPYPWQQDEELTTMADLLTLRSRSASLYTQSRFLCCLSPSVHARATDAGIPPASMTLASRRTAAFAVGSPPACIA